MKACRKKILIACDSSHTLLGFRGKLIEELTKSLEVHVFTPKISDNSVLKILKRLKVKVHENGLLGSKVAVISDLRYLVALYRLMRKIKPDIFFPYTFKPVIYGSMVAKICNVGHITPMLTGLGYNFSSDVKKNTFVSKLTKILLKFSLNKDRRMHIIFQNKDDYDKLLVSKIIGLKHTTSVVSGSGVDLSHYEFSIPDTQQITFLMIARLINAKGIKEFYEAAKMVKHDFPEVKFRLIGPYDDNIDAINNELYKKIESGSVVEYLGEIKDIRPFIQAASVVVLPSYYGEGIPRCLLEAMAIGRPIITCDSVGCRETVISIPEKRNGFLVPVKNIAALAAAMIHYLNGKQEVVINGINGHHYAQERFDVKIINAEMLKIIYS